jgi:hypothetical protein
MPHRYIGPDEFYYTREIATPRSLNNGDWIIPGDVEYMIANHPSWVELVGEDDIPEDEPLLIPIRTRLPEAPPAGFCKLYIRNGVLVLLDSNGSEQIVGEQTTP